MVNLVYKVGGEKHCRPITTPEGLKEACNTPENIQNWNMYRQTGEDRYKLALVQVNYNCQVPEGGLLKGNKTVSPFFFYDIDCRDRDECRRIISQLLEMREKLGLVELAESAGFGVHAVGRREPGTTILENQVRISVLTQTEMDTNNKENNRVVFHGPIDAETTPLLDEALFTESLSDEEAALLKVGDVNEDGEITTADVVCALNYIMGRTNDSFEFKQADTDENGYVTMRDVADIVRMMLENTPKSSRRYQLPMAEAALSLQSFEAEAGKVAEMPLALTVGEGSYCGLQFDVNLPAGCTLEGVQLPEGMSGYSVALSELQPNRYRVSIYGSAQQTISEGKSEMKLDILPDMPLAAEQCVVTITDAMLVDEDAEDNRLSSTAVKFSMPTEGATGVGRNAVNGADTPQYIYDMQGRNVTRLSQHGVYIINGKKVVK